MKFGTAMDFYDNDGVICDMTNYIFYSEKGKQIDKSKESYEKHIKTEWKFVALPHLDNFKSDDITKIKDVLNGIPGDYNESHHLYNCIKKLENACFNKDKDLLDDCLKLILETSLNNM